MVARNSSSIAVLVFVSPAFSSPITAPLFAWLRFVFTLFTVNNMWARYLPVYLYAVSDEAYDDDDSVRSSANDAVPLKTGFYCFRARRG